MVHPMRPSLVTSLATLTSTVALVVLGACDDSSTTPSSSTTSSTSTGTGGTAGAGGIIGGGGTSAGGGAGGPTGGGGAGGVDTCGIGTVAGGGAGPGGGAPTDRIRVVAANLTSGNDQSYDGGHGVRILQGLDAHVVLMQEMNFGNNSLTAIGSLVDDVCDGQCNYIRGPQAQIPNGVVSRLPILECGSWVDPEVDNRNFVWARIDVPGDADLWAISVHFLSSGSSKRTAEANALLNHIAGAIPPADLIVLGGDLNTTSRTEGAITALASLFDTASPYPADHNNNGMTNEPRNEPYDWVLADSELSAFEIPVTIGQSVFSAGAVIDTRVYTPLSEIAPAQQGDSGAPSMQHMAVVKDFHIQ